MNELPHSPEGKATAITASSNTVYDMMRQGGKGGWREGGWGEGGWREGGWGEGGWGEGGWGEGGTSGVGGVPDDDYHYNLIGLSMKGPPPAKPLEDDEYEKMIRLQTLPAVPSPPARPTWMQDIVNADGAGEKDNVYEHIPGDK